MSSLFHLYHYDHCGIFTYNFRRFLQTLRFLFLTETEFFTWLYLRLRERGGETWHNWLILFLPHSYTCVVKNYRMKHHGKTQNWSLCDLHQWIPYHTVLPNSSSRALAWWCFLCCNPLYGDIRKSQVDFPILDLKFVKCSVLVKTMNYIWIINDGYWHTRQVDCLGYLLKMFSHNGFTE